MALCTSCGSEVAEAASFCTSCGQRMPAALQPAAAVTATRSVCSACGAPVDPASAFCTNCGQRISDQALAGTASGPSAVEPAAPAATNAATLTRDAEATPAARVEPAVAAIPAKPEVAATIPLAATAPAAQSAEAVPAPPSPPQVAPPLYAAAPSDYSPAQPGGSFRIVVLILLLVIVVGIFGGWYFWGVETVIVCSPPDVRVFLDDKELTPSSYGRYVIPHLSRQPHLLKVQRPGFADTIQRLDFSMVSLHEWVNIKLVPSGQMRSSPR